MPKRWIRGARAAWAALALAFVLGASERRALAEASPVDAGAADANAQATSETARRLVRAAQERGGSYRAEVGRQLEAMGDVAVPALIEAKGPDFPLDVRRWAVAVLESMNKKIPGEAIQTKDNRLLAEVLRAYGKTRDLDAVGVVFAFANVDRNDVRSAAREAIRQYGDGAISKLRETYTNLKSRPPKDTWSTAELTDELFKLMDGVRLREVYLQLDDALKKASAAGDEPAQLEPLVTQLDQVLARQPLLDRRAEAAPVYARFARALDETDPARALAYYRKAERLDPEGPEKDRVRSAVAYLEAKELATHGVVDVEGFRRAVELDPQNARAQDEIARIEGHERAEKQRARLWLFGGVAGLVFVSAMILFVRVRLRAA